VDVQAGGRGRVRPPAIGDHPGVRLDVVGEERSQRVGRRVEQRRHAATAQPLGLSALDGDPDEHLLALLPPAAQPWLLAAEVALVDLHLARQPLAARSHQHRPQPVQHRQKSGISALNLKRLLEIGSYQTAWWEANSPAGHEPDGQRGAGAIEDGPRSGRTAGGAGDALQAPVTQPPAPGVRAAGTDEPAGPAQPLQVVQAVSVSRKPGLELAERPRVLLSRLRSDRTRISTPVRWIPHHPRFRRLWRVDRGLLVVPMEPIA
jgi:hypothetical protein